MARKGYNALLSNAKAKHVQKRFVYIAIGAVVFLMLFPFLILHGIPFVFRQIKDFGFISTAAIIVSTLLVWKRI